MCFTSVELEVFGEVAPAKQLQDHTLYVLYTFYYGLSFLTWKNFSDRDNTENNGPEDWFNAPTKQLPEKKNNQ